MAEVAAEWRRAQESLGAALVCRDNGFYADAVSRAYYAIMHAAKAALPNDVKADSHNGLINQFSLHLIKTGTVESEWMAYLRDGREARSIADYKVAVVFAHADAQDACDRADAFLNRIRFLLGNAVVPAG